MAPVRRASHAVACCLSFSHVSFSHSAGGGTSMQKLEHGGVRGGGDAGGEDGEHDVQTPHVTGHAVREAASAQLL